MVAPHAFRSDAKDANLWGWLQTQQHTSHAAHLQNDLASEMQRGCRWLRFLSIFKKRTVGSSDLPHESNPTCSQKIDESCSADISFCTPPKGYRMRSESLFKFQINPAFQQNSKENRAS
jgi:hypothetical protein